MPTTDRILFVDDEKNVLRALQRSFIDEDYEILTAQSGPEALALLEREIPVSLVVSDYRMPGMNGVELLRKVCEAWPQATRIVLSGFADAPAVVAAINQGKIFRFIPKPWDEEELKTSVRDGIEQFRQLQAVAQLQETVQDLERENEQLLSKSREVASRLVIKDWAFSQAADILNALPVGILGVDSDGRVVFCNQAGETLLRQSATGRPWQDLFPEQLRNQVTHALLSEGRYAGEHVHAEGHLELDGYFLQPTTRQGILLILKGANHV